MNGAMVRLFPEWKNCRNQSIAGQNRKMKSTNSRLGCSDGNHGLEPGMPIWQMNKCRHGFLVEGLVFLFWDIVTTRCTGIGNLGVASRGIEPKTENIRVYKFGKFKSE